MIGRPPSPGPKRTEQIKVLVTPELYSRIAAAAAADGRSVSDWVMRACEAELSMAPRGSVQDRRLDRENLKAYRKQERKKKGARR